MGCGGCVMVMGRRMGHGGLSSSAVFPTWKWLGGFTWVWWFATGWHRIIVRLGFSTRNDGKGAIVKRFIAVS